MKTDVLFLLFVTALFAALKLTGCIYWSWWGVTLPLWVIAVLVFLAVLEFHQGIQRGDR